MEHLLLLFLLAGLSNMASASDKFHEWILEQYGIKEFISRAQGRIDGEEYIALSQTDSNDINIYLFRKTPGQPVLIAKFDEPNPIGSSIVTIKNNSIYLEYGNGHHGLYAHRYQFKQIDGKFRLVGYETRSDTSCFYAAGGDEAASVKCRNVPSEIFSGASYNLLASAVICFQEAYNWRKGRFSKLNEPGGTVDWSFPKNGVSYRMLIPPIKSVDLSLLDGFDFYDSDFRMPEFCYFDYKNKLILPQSKAIKNE